MSLAEREAGTYKRLDNDEYNEKHGLVYTGPSSIFHGRYTAKWESINHQNTSCFAIRSWKSRREETTVTFYEKSDDGTEQVLFTKVGSCVIMYGDGKTRTGTLFSIYKAYDPITIFNMNGELIRTTKVGYDVMVDMCRVPGTEEYAIALTEELCTYDPFTSIIYLEDFFYPKPNMEPRAYDNARTPMPLTMNHEERYYPLTAEVDGFRVRDRVTQKIFTVPYSDAYTEKFDWDYGYGDEDEANVYVNKHKLLNDMIIDMVAQHTGIDPDQADHICIPAANLPTDFLAKVAEMYDTVMEPG